MSVLSSKKASMKKSSISATQFVARRSQQKQNTAVPMLSADKVPAGRYHSRVASMADAVSGSGDAAIDVVYQLTHSSGKTVDARIRYTVDSYHFNRFVDAMLDAGLEDGAALGDAVGLEEELTIVYPYAGALGKIQTRAPAGASVKPASQKPASSKTVPAVLDEPDEDDEAENAEDDSKFDDFLEEEDFDED